MKGENPDKIRFSSFSLSLLFHHFPDNWQNSSLSLVGFLYQKMYICILNVHYNNL